MSCVWGSLTSLSCAGGRKFELFLFYDLSNAGVFFFVINKFNGRVSKMISADKQDVLELLNFD